MNKARSENNLKQEREREKSCSNIQFCFINKIYDLLNCTIHIQCIPAIVCEEKYHCQKEG